MNRMMVIAHGKLSKNSVRPPFIKIISGKNVMLIDSVAESIDLKKWRALSIAACQRDMPDERSSI